MQTKVRKDMAFGVVVLIVGVVYLVLAAQLPRAGGIDSSTVPYFLSSLITLLGVVQIVGAVRAGRRAEAEPPANAGPKPDYGTVLVTGVLIFLYVVLLDSVGFMVMSALYLFVQISVLTPKYEKPGYGKYALIAVATAAIVYYLFFWAFDIMLPHGWVWSDMGIYMDWSPFE